MDSILTFSSTYLYFIGALLYGIPFFALFLKRKESRKEMLIVGLICGLAGIVLSQYALVDYWHPKYLFEGIPLEDFIYAFFFGGFASECADIFYKHRIKKHKKRFRIIFVIFLFCLFTFSLLLHFYKVNSIVMHFLPLLFAGLLSIAINLKNMKIQIVSGLITLFVTLLIFSILLLIDNNFFTDNWYWENLSGHSYYSIPIEEYIFAFLMGFGLASFYKVTEGLDRFIK